MLGEIKPTKTTKIYLLTIGFEYARISKLNLKSEYASIAQSVEQLIRNQQVVCSSHITSSSKRRTLRRSSFAMWKDAAYL